MKSVNGNEEQSISSGPGSPTPETAIPVCWVKVEPLPDDVCPDLNQSPELTESPSSMVDIQDYIPDMTVTDADLDDPLWNESGKARNRIVNYQFTEEQEIELAQFYKDHPVFYNKKVRDFMNTTKKKAILQEKAAEFKDPPCSYTQLMTFFKSMRTRFGKIQLFKKKGRKITRRDLFIYNTFSFLDSHIVRSQNRKKRKLFRKKVIPFRKKIVRSSRDRYYCEDKDDDPEDVAPPPPDNATCWIKVEAPDDDGPALIQQPVFPGSPVVPPYSSMEELQGYIPDIADLGDCSWRDIPKQPRQRICNFLFSEEQEKELAEFYRDHPIFYNKKVRNFKNSAKKMAILQEKAAQFTDPICTYAQLMTFFKSMRTRYGKIQVLKQSKPDYTLSERDQYIDDTFNFLKPHIVRVYNRRRSSKHSVVYQDEQESEEDEKEDYDELSMVSSLSTQSQQKTAAPPVAKRIKPSLDMEVIPAEVPEEVTQICERLPVKADPPEAKTDHEKVVNSFVEYMNTQLKQIHPSHWFDFSMEALPMVQKYIVKGQKRH